jgi:predicted GIY-YIG superfamily endonuclease
MSMPLSLENMFDSTYEGMRAARFKSASEAHNMEVSLKELKHSFKTKIVKHKRRGNEFIVMIVGEHNA